MSAISSKDLKKILELISSMFKEGKKDEVIEILKSATESTEQQKELIRIANTTDNL